MKITGGPLYLGISLFLLSIELICSQPQPIIRADHTKAADMFPDSHGVHFPKLEKVSPKRINSLPKFNVVNGHKRNTTFLVDNYLKRGNYIFAYTLKNDIKYLGVLFEQPTLYPAFEILTEKWYTLPFGDLKKLGVSRSVLSVYAQDKVHEKVHKPFLGVNNDYHNRACEAAYAVTIKYEAFVERSGVGQEEAINLIHDYYNHHYNVAYQQLVGGSSHHWTIPKEVSEPNQRA